MEKDFKFFRSKSNERVRSVRLKEDMFMSWSIRKSDSTGNGLDYRLSFEVVNDAKDRLVEFEPRNGPFSFVRKTEMNDTKHYLFGDCKKDGWLQLDVEESGLVRAFLHNDYDEVYRIMKNYVENKTDFKLNIL